jgi:hypothetical protein
MNHQTICIITKGSDQGHYMQDEEEKELVS